VSSLAAELVNTRPRPADPAEKLTGPDAAAALLAPFGIEGEASLPDLLRVRASLLAAFEARDMEALAAALNPLLARAPAPRLMPGWALRAPTEELSVADRVAVAAAAELASLAAAHGLDRLGFCAADDCQAVFADTSARGSRRYCSRTCSTRTNVRRHRHTAR
jgi:predicted RNA-binding Zn ribbon-like protein